MFLRSYSMGAFLVVLKKHKTSLKPAVYWSNNTTDRCHPTENLWKLSLASAVKLRMSSWIPLLENPPLRWTLTFFELPTEPGSDPVKLCWKSSKSYSNLRLNTTLRMLIIYWFCMAAIPVRHEHRNVRSAWLTSFVTIGQKPVNQNESRKHRF